MLAVLLYWFNNYLLQIFLDLEGGKAVVHHKNRDNNKWNAKFTLQEYFLLLILCIIYTNSKIYRLYQTGSVDTWVAAFNKGTGINYQLAEIAANKTGGGEEKNLSGKADTYNVL